MACFVLMVLNFEVMNGQGLPVSFNFDDCNFEEANAGFPGITPGGNPNCVCGLGSNSMYLDGIGDFLEISNQANILLDSNFTLDFYFWMDPQVGESDVFSLRSGCSSLDSLMTLRYFSDTDELLFEIGSDVNNYFSVRKELSDNTCWHRFSLVKFNLEYFIYFDNILAKKILSRENIIFSRIAKISFGNSPCNMVNNASRFKGRIDEINLSKRAFSELEILKSFKYPDRIITPNTTIFKGESITLQLGNTCASQILWSPSISLDLVNVADPVASPEISTTYKVVLDNGSCMSNDTVRIYVADKTKLDCDQLLLPKAFTPNNDGLNDKYGISNIFLVEALEYFEVYDRWGAKIWSARNLSDAWDGTFNNQPVNTGMYLYKIKYTCNGEEKLNVNNFSLLR